MYSYCDVQWLTCHLSFVPPPFFLIASGPSTALAVCSKKHWSEPCTFNFTNKPSTNDPVVPTSATANGEVPSLFALHLQRSFNFYSLSERICLLDLYFHFWFYLILLPMNMSFLKMAISNNAWESECRFFLLFTSTYFFICLHRFRRTSVYKSSTRWCRRSAMFPALLDNKSSKWVNKCVITNKVWPWRSFKISCVWLHVGHESSYCDPTSFIPFFFSTYFLSHHYNSEKNMLCNNRSCWNI